MINIEKTYPAPSELNLCSLNQWDTDFLLKLKDDFNRKCYICERKGNSESEVEHFLPTSTHPELALAWENLFWSCRYCNGIKSNKFQPLLNCTNLAHEICKWISFQFQNQLGEPAQIHIEPSSSAPQNYQTEISNTLQLLKVVYDAQSPMRSIQTDDIRKLLLIELSEFKKVLGLYWNTRSQQEKQEYLDKIRYELSEKSAFTAFKIWIVLNKPKLKQEFAHLIPSTIYQEHYEFPS